VDPVEARIEKPSRVCAIRRATIEHTTAACEQQSGDKLSVKRRFVPVVNLNRLATSAIAATAIVLEAEPRLDPLSPP
jgi:hypothetical protein